MSIVWKHVLSRRSPTRRTVGSCPHCTEGMLQHRGNRPPRGRCYSVVGDFDLQAELGICARCGWWSFRHYLTFESSAGSVYETHGVDSSLVEFDLADISVPLRELRNHLVENPEDRFLLHPSRLEELVASVFSDFGFQAVVTGKSGDGGIDVVLHDGRDRVAVQVKRYKGSLEVGQIREFVGAMVLGDVTKGVFVTTSRFQSGAETAKAAYRDRGYEVELLDGERFLRALDVAQLRFHESFRDFDEACDVLQVPEAEFPSIDRYVLRSGDAIVDDGSGIID